MIVALAAGTLIGALTTVVKRDVAYGLVIIWAFSGILLKHLSSTGFNGSYKEVIYAVSVALIVMLVAVIKAVVKAKK